MPTEESKCFLHACHVLQCCGEPQVQIRLNPWEREQTKEKHWCSMIHWVPKIVRFNQTKLSCCPNDFLGSMYHLTTLSFLPEKQNMWDEPSKPILSVANDHLSGAYDTPNGKWLGHQAHQPCKPLLTMQLQLCSMSGFWTMAIECIQCYQLSLP